MHGRQVTLDSSLRKTEERGMSPWNSGRGGGGVRTRSYTPDLSASGEGGGRGRYLYSSLFLIFSLKLNWNRGLKGTVEPDFLCVFLGLY